MMVICMNDPGPIADPNNPGQTITDPLFQSGYSDFCYELPFMPGQTRLLRYPGCADLGIRRWIQHPDCSYPDATPAISEVDGDGIGPWVAGLKGAVTKVTVGGRRQRLYQQPLSHLQQHRHRRNRRGR